MDRRDRREGDFVYSAENRLMGVIRNLELKATDTDLNDPDSLLNQLKRLQQDLKSGVMTHEAVGKTLDDLEQ